MCGACGVKPDWAGPVVAGPLRRRDIARCLTMLVKAATVHSMSRGWLVKGRTGISIPAQTLDELVDALLPYTHIASWAQFEQALLEVPSPMRVDAPENQWPFISEVPAEVKTVLAAVTHLPPHMKLAAFTLGVRSFSSPTLVSTNIDGLHWLCARDGYLLKEKASQTPH